MQNITTKIIKSSVYSVFIFALLFSYTVHAQSMLYFEQPAHPVANGEEFQVRIQADTDDPINAYIVNFSYSKNSLALLSFDNSHSIIDAWQSQPNVYESGLIRFKGGSLQPFSGKGGNLLTIRFKALSSGTAVLDFHSPSFYRADGKGTKVIPRVRDVAFSILPSSVFQAIATSPIQANIDVVAPDIQFLSFVEDPFNQQQKLLSFSAKDEGSGIKTVSYRTRTSFFWGDFQPAINPVPLPQEVWMAQLQVMDNTGNVSNRTIYAWPALVKNPILSIIIGLFILFLLAKISKNMKNMIKKR